MRGHAGVLLMILLGCSREPSRDIVRAPEGARRTTMAVDAGEPLSLEEQARIVARAFRAKDLATVAQLTHPVKGVRFSPYGYVEPTHVVIPRAQLVARLADPTKQIWGSYDGSGDAITLTFAEYLDRFVCDVDFARAPEVAVDRTLGHGNTIANHAEHYPGARVVELHFKGFDPKYDGMDWRSLRLAFERYDGAWLLVGVIHDEWTI